MPDQESRRKFYDRLRWALRKGRHDRVRATEPLFPPLQAPAQMAGNGRGASPAALAEFEEELRGAGGAFTRLSEQDALRRYLEEFARQRQVRSAVANASPLVEHLGLLAMLRELGVEVRRWSLSDTNDAALAEAGEPGFCSLPHAGREELAAADLGITGVDWAIAETGTIVLAALPGRPRLTSLVPPVHLALMTPADLLTGMEDFFLELRRLFLTDPSRASSSTTLITGSSRTGDIEHKLTRGVHGPKEVHVIYWEGDLPERLSS